MIWFSKNHLVYLFPSLSLSPCLSLSLSTTWPTSTLSSAVMSSVCWFRLHTGFSLNIDPANTQVRVQHLLAVWKWAWCVQMLIRSCCPCRTEVLLKHGRIKAEKFNLNIVFWKKSVIVPWGEYSLHQMEVKGQRLAQGHFVSCSFSSR